MNTEKGFEDLQLLKIASLILGFSIGGYKWCAIPLHWTLLGLLVHHFHDGEINQDVSCQIKKIKGLVWSFRYSLDSYPKAEEPI